jgi:uncharacterized glyoxalase superfamily protein PhnB
MSTSATGSAGAVVPTLRYRDLPAAIDWLCKAFGFERHLVVPGDNGSIRYAQLTFNGGMVMLAPVEDSAFDGLMTQPAETGGAETQICYLFVEDANNHYARAKAAGAEIVFDLGDGRSNGRGYSCRDPEGHIWNFGTYDPWRRGLKGSLRRTEKPRASGARRLAFRAGLLGTALASMLLIGWFYGAIEVAFGDFVAFSDVAPGSGGEPRAATERTIKELRDQFVKERSAKETAERTAGLAIELLNKERNAKQVAERAAQDAREQLAQERSAREAAESSATDARARLAQEQIAKSGSEHGHKTSELQAREEFQQLELERSTREAAERSDRDAREQLTRERSARDAAVRAAKEAREQIAKERARRAARDARQASEFSWWQQQW